MSTCLRLTSTSVDIIIGIKKELSEIDFDDSLPLAPSQVSFI